MKKFRIYSNAVERFLHSNPGQRFFNIAYSLGAAIVIWGALFKILHLPGGNALLCVGMGTEILMFILTAFDRPPKNDYEFKEETLESGEMTDNKNTSIGNPSDTSGNSIVLPVIQELNSDEVDSINNNVVKISDISANLQRLAVIAESTTNFMETFNSIASQMDSLNRNLQGLNTIYEIQLKNISGQLDTIDKVNRGLKDIRDMYEKSAKEASGYCEETEKMTRYLKQINAVYEKMITAMTLNINPVANPFSQTSDLNSK